MTLLLTEASLCEEAMSLLQKAKSPMEFRSIRENVIAETRSRFGDDAAQEMDDALPDTP